MPPHRWLRDIKFLSALLVVDLLIALVVAWKVPFQAPNPSYMCDAIQFATTHHVASVFLPVGFSGILGISYWLAGQAGMTALSILLSLVVVVAAWVYLRTLGVPTRTTLAVTAMLSVYPDFLLSYNKAQDTALTAAVLFTFVVLVVRSIAAKRFGWVEMLLSLLLGYAAMARPNLALLVPLVWLAYWKFGVPRATLRLAGVLAIAAVFYMAGTAAIHGRPFLPHNGPYNLYSGANEFTETYIGSEETSLVQAMAMQGVTVVNPPTLCILESTDPNALDVHDRRLDPLYIRFALQFMRRHPAATAHLVWMKFWTLMRPDFTVHSPQSVGGVFKILAALAFPLWMMAVIWWPHPGPPATRFILVATAIVYIVPFLLTISSARFRVPLDIFLWVDLGGIVAVRYFAATPRPA